MGCCHNLQVHVLVEQRQECPSWSWFELLEIWNGIQSRGSVKDMYTLCFGASGWCIEVCLMNVSLQGSDHPYVVIVVLVGI